MHKHVRMVRFFADSASLRTTLILQPCLCNIRTRLSHCLPPTTSIPHTHCALLFVLYSILVHATLLDTIQQRRVLLVEFEVCGYVVCSVVIPSTRTLFSGLIYFYAS